MSIEIIIVLITGYFNINPLTRSQYGSILGIIIIRIISYFIVLVIENYKNIRDGDIIPVTYWLCIAIIPIGTLYLSIIIFMEDKMSPITIFWSTTLVFFINFATFYLYDRISQVLLDKTDKLLIEQQNKYYINQLELMKLSLESTKTIKHDLKNHISSLYTLAENYKREEILKYLSEVIKGIDNQEGLATTGNVVIDSIINFKLQEANKKGVSVNLDLNIPKELGMSQFDITVILGNLIDNSLDAVRKLNRNRYINIRMKYTKGRLILELNNSYDGTLIKKNNRIVTSKEDINNHGLGLKSVKRVLERYDGTMKIKYDDKQFNIILLIYME